MPITFDDLIAKKKPVTHTLWIALDTQAAEDLVAAETEFDRARLRLDATPSSPESKKAFEKAEAKLEKAREHARANSAKFVVQSIGRDAYEALSDMYPATPKQKKEAEKNGEPEPRVDASAYSIGLIAACLVEPELTEDQVRQLWNDPNWNQSELIALSSAAARVNIDRPLLDLGKD